MKKNPILNNPEFSERKSHFSNQEAVPQLCNVFILLILALCGFAVDSSGQVRLVADLNTGKKSPIEAKPFSQNESDGGRAYFVGESNELWTSDGTTSGTKFIKAFVQIKEIEVIGDICYFSADTDDKGNELWKSDGTGAGTVRVKDIVIGTGSSTPMFLTNVNGVLYFSANDGGYNRELWKSDGTAGGTQLVEDIYPGNSGSSANLTAAGGRIFFVAKTELPGYELWVSDGTSGGTYLVKDINPGVAGSSITDITESNGKVYFSAQSPLRGRQLWESDGTDSGTSIVKVINTSGSALVSDLTEVNGLIFFLATDGVHGVELFRSDGTSGGTFMLKDINFPLTAFSSVNGKLFFTSYESVNTSDNRSIWMSDGTTAGTVQVTSTEQYSELYVSLLQVYHEINGAAYFFGIDQNIYQGYMYRIDTNGALTVVKEVPWSDEDRIQVVRIGNLSHFLADGYYWRTDGTSAGTYWLRTLCCGDGSRPLYLEDAGGTLFFSTIDTNPQAFWKTNGTAASTIQVELDFVEEMEGLNDDMFYRLGDSFGPGSSVWKIDGETNSKTQMSSIATDPRYIVDAIDRVYFVADTPLNGRKLWVSDGTPEGTHAINASPDPSTIVSLGHKAIFNSNSQLWVSDGTEAGTQLLINLLQFPQFLTEFNGDLYFFGSDATHGLELWKTNGTPSGTSMVKDIRQNDTENVSFYDLHNGEATDDWLYFSGINPQGKLAIWRTDGTDIGTTEVIAFEPKSETEYLPSLIGPAGSKVFFVRVFDSGSEVWVLDGSTATKLKTLEQQYSYINAIDGNVVYMITRSGPFSPERNEEVWRSDGTFAGTYQIKFQGRPYLLATSGDYVYLAGRADKEGSELFIIEESDNNTLAKTAESTIALQTPPEEEVIYSYPSPFSSTFTLNVSGEENSTFSLEVVSVAGRQVSHENLLHNVPHQIESSSWPDGMYLVKVKSRSRMLMQKVIKLSD